jgi:hypothetical protein
MGAAKATKWGIDGELVMERKLGFGKISGLVATLYLFSFEVSIL